MKKYYKTKKINKTKLKTYLKKKKNEGSARYTTSRNSK
tara:strand:+ start:7834 stop:7947 length:114 start_codon:yes stop_codon:yes gene_type:complete